MDYQFNLRLLITHPTYIVDEIKQNLALAPTIGHDVNTKKITPKGNNLPGFYKESMFGYTITVKNDRYFFKHVEAFILSLSPHYEFLKKIHATGGKCSIFIDLINNDNIGDVISLSLLALTNELKIEIGVEQFINQNG